MKMNRIYTAVAGIALVILAGLFIYVGPRTAAPEQAVQTESKTLTVSLSVQGLYTSKQVNITEGETILQLLQAQSAQDPAMNLTTKEYAGMGTLVTGIGGSINGTGNDYWQYKVNGVSPQIGADAYVLKSGDVIDWYFGPSQE